MSDFQQQHVVIIGGGPAGLMAAETLGAAGTAVTLYERMPTVGRKFLMAGRGGLNLTHSEPLPTLLSRYGDARSQLSGHIRQFNPDDLRAWAAGLGQETFVGSSGRIFPAGLKTSPLLRAWLARLNQLGVKIETRHEWIGWNDNNQPVFKSGAEIKDKASDATILALGGASWPRLGSTGEWTSRLAEKNIPLSPLRPANCGFTVAWSTVFRGQFEGRPLKNIVISFADRSVRGEALITSTGIEGGAIYTLSALIRDTVSADLPAILLLDLCPDIPLSVLTERLKAPRRGQSLSNYLRKTAGLSPVAINLLREVTNLSSFDNEKELAALIKAAPLTLRAPQSIERAISTAGGIRWDALDQQLMIRAMPGVFVAGEMVDWEAPTGGYLLQACFSTGFAAAKGALAWLNAGRA